MIRRAPLRRRGKFNAHKVIRGGERYDSRMEAGYVGWLTMLARVYRLPNEKPVGWIRQVEVPFDVNGVHICNYKCDFVIRFADGHEEWHEVKGFETPEWRLKERLFRACYPERILRVFRSNGNGAYYEVLPSRGRNVRRSAKPATRAR